MARGRLGGVLRHLRQVAGLSATQRLADAQLLERYVACRDEEAFATLVGLYGRLVRSVCRHVLHHEQDIDDAFQATFLVFARKATSIRKSTSVASWLYGVAYRTALNARRARLRRREEQGDAERCAAEQPVSEAALREVQAILDDEVQRLPEKYRAPFVLCCLEGMSRAEAADQLGLKEGTVSSRLAQARKDLQQRLARRGVVLSAALCAAELSRTTATAAVPPALLNSTIQAALSFATGKTLADLACAEVAGLARGVLQNMGTTSLKGATAVLLAVGFVASAGLFTWQALAGRPAVQDRPAAPSQAAPRTDLFGDPLPEGAIARMGSIQWRHAGLAGFAFRDGGKEVVTVGVGRTVRFWDMASGKPMRAVTLQSTPGWPLALSGDGRTLAGQADGKLLFWATDTGKQIQTLDAGKADIQTLDFAPDGRTLASMTGKGLVVLWDWRNGKQRQLPGEVLERQGLDSTAHVAFSPDGRLVAVGIWWMKPLRIHETATGREVRRFDGQAARSAFSPDGKRLAVLSLREKAGKSHRGIRHFDLASGMETACYPLRSDDFFGCLKFSPDGQTVACGGYSQSCLQDCATGMVPHYLPGHTDLAFSPDGKVVAASSRGRLRFFDTRTGKELYDRPSSFSGMHDGVDQLAVSPDGRRLASLNQRENAVFIWDTASGRLAHRLLLPHVNRSSVSGLAFAPHGGTLLVGRWNGAVESWDLASGVEVRTVSLRGEAVPVEEGFGYYLLHASADGKHLSTVEQRVGREWHHCKRLAVWENTTGKLLHEYPMPLKSWVCSWSPGGAALALATDDGMEVREVDSGRVCCRIRGTSRGGILAASGDRQLIALLGTKEAGRPSPGRTIKEGAVEVWEAKSGKQITRVAAGPAAHLALVRGGRCLVTTDEGFLRVWDLATGSERRRWALPSGTIDAWGTSIVSDLLALPDGRRVVTTLFDGTALVWDLSAALDSLEPLARSADARTIAAWWADLAGDDARRAYAAVWRLAEAPGLALPFLRERLRPAPEPDGKRIRQLINDLDSDTFAVREKAYEELESLGSAAVGALRQALQKAPSPEVRRRVERLLANLPDAPLPAPTLRDLRALHALEQMGTPGAREWLRQLAGGAAEAPLTREARACLKRLARRPEVQP
jgi:RNA polymerase sigma factor (sigma-70 family)